MQMPRRINGLRLQALAAPAIPSLAAEVANAVGRFLSRAQCCRAFLRTSPTCKEAPFLYSSPVGLTILLVVGARFDVGDPEAINSDWRE
jgi:hypothetical protein